MDDVEVLTWPLYGEGAKALAQMIDDAKSVAIFGGDGCRNARDEVIQLAERLKAPVGYSFRGKQWLEHDNPNLIGGDIAGGMADLAADSALQGRLLGLSLDSHQ